MCCLGEISDRVQDFGKFTLRFLSLKTAWDYFKPGFPHGSIIPVEGWVGVGPGYLKGHDPDGDTPIFTKP